jgi:hypothetical protein
MIITFVPPFDTRRKLEVEGGLPVDDMHITLFHFEDEGYEHDYDMGIRILEVLTKYAASTATFGASIPTLDRFSNVRKMQNVNGDIVDALHPTDVIIGKIDSLHLNSEREKIKVLLDEIGAPYSQTFKDFVPHISLKYVPHGEMIAPIDLPQHFLISSVEFWPKEGERLVFHFASN